MATISRRGTGNRSWQITGEDVDVLLTIYENHTTVYAPVQPDALKYSPVPDIPFHAALHMDEHGSVTQSRGHLTTVDGVIGYVDMVGDAGRAMASRGLEIWTSDPETTERYRLGVLEELQEALTTEGKQLERHRTELAHKQLEVTEVEARITELRAKIASLQSPGSQGDGPF